MAINSRYPTLATVSHMTTGNKHYAVAEGDTCLLRVPVRAMMSSFELLVNLFGIAVWLRVIALSKFQGSSHYPTPTGPAPCRNMERSMQGPYEIYSLAFTTLISADSLCQSFELLLELHKRIQAIYFSCDQSVVIIDLADSAASSPSLIGLNVN